MFANMHEYTAYQRPNISHFTTRSFQIFSEEKDCLVQLREAIFQYMVIIEGKGELDLPSLASFISASTYTNKR